MKPAYRSRKRMQKSAEEYKKALPHKMGKSGEEKDDDKLGGSILQGQDRGALPRQSYSLLAHSAQTPVTVRQWPSMRRPGIFLIRAFSSPSGRSRFMILWHLRQ